MEKKYCRECGRDITDDDAYCKRCKEEAEEKAKHEGYDYAEAETESNEEECDELHEKGYTEGYETAMQRIKSALRSILYILKDSEDINVSDEEKDRVKRILDDFDLELTQSVINILLLRRYTE